MLRRFDRVLALTDIEKQVVPDRERVTSIGVGSDPYAGQVSPGEFRARHRIPAAAPVVLFVGRKILNKGVVHLLQAMDQVWDVHPEARLVLLGFAHNSPEWLEGYLSQSRHDARTRVLTLDDASEETRENALAACSVMAMPSISDSFGIVYLEAWRYRKPVMACRGTCGEFVVEHDRDGVLVEFGDVDGIARELMQLLGDPGIAARMGDSGFEKWRMRYQWSQVADRMEEAIALARDPGHQRESGR
jgi:glycosyltransferase involved in cell wall biosynthesis